MNDVIVTATHPTTFESHNVETSSEGAYHIMQALQLMGYLGVMGTVADYFHSGSFEDPWAALREKGHYAGHSHTYVGRTDTAHKYPHS